MVFFHVYIFTLCTCKCTLISSDCVVTSIINEKARAMKQKTFTKILKVNILLDRFGMYERVATWSSKNMPTTWHDLIRKQEQRKSENKRVL